MYFILWTSLITELFLHIKYRSRASFLFYSYTEDPVVIHGVLKKVICRQTLLSDIDGANK